MEVEVDAHAAAAAGGGKGCVSGLVIESVSVSAVTEVVAPGQLSSMRSFRALSLLSLRSLRSLLLGRGGGWRVLLAPRSSLLATAALPRPPHP